VLPQPVPPSLRAAPKAGRRRVVLGLLAEAAGAAWPATSRAARSAAWRDILGQLSGVEDGRGGTRVVVFFDLRCPACAVLYRRSRAAVGAGRLFLRWVPVAILGPSSLLRGARWLAQGDARDVLARAFAGLPAQPADAARVAAMLPLVQRNTATLQRIAPGRLATPTLVVEGRDGRLRLQFGLSEDAGPR
jgi:hypothetical protein